MTGRVGPVIVDEVHGHITVQDITFCDVGQTLSVWSHSGADLTLEDATSLGDALIAWARRKADQLFEQGPAALATPPPVVLTNDPTTCPHAVLDELAGIAWGYADCLGCGARFGVRDDIDEQEQ